MTSLSNSALWQRMAEYYDEMGPEVWEDEVVPLQITTNKYIVNVYARLIIAQINDFLASQPNPAEPFYIIETGVGHGKFSFYMVKALTEALATYRLPPNSIRYIMTDISEKNIEYWSRHQAFKPYIASGIIDFALYNVLESEPLHLKLSNEVVSARQLNTPIFSIFNYVFDSLPQDAFQVIQGKLHETEIVIEEKKTKHAHDLAKYFKQTKYSYKHNPISTNYYPHQPALNKILEFYENYFEDASFLIPMGAFKALKNLQQFTNAPLIVLAADKGNNDLGLFNGLDDPDITEHGSVSMMVNFDAIARFTDLNGGKSLLMGNKSADFQVATFITQNQYPNLHTEFAFQNALSAFSPQDLFNIAYKNDEPNASFKDLEDIIAILNLSDWDPNIFYDYHAAILNALEDTDVTIEQDLALVIGLEKVWDYFFKLEKTQDIPFAIGAIFYHLDYLDKAVIFYQYSLEQFGEQEETYYNLALVYQELKQNPKALEAAERALAVNPSYPEAKKLIKELTTTPA